jgi:hypothetical protein
MSLQPLHRSLQGEQNIQSLEHLNDALSFLAMEKAFGQQEDEASKTPNIMKGIDAATIAASARDNQGMWRGIGKEALDKVANASRAGTLTSLTNSKEDFDSMEAIRKRQIQISHRHMAFDVAHDALDTQTMDFSSKDFLSKFQEAHVTKEKDLQGITTELEALAKDIGNLHESKANFKTPTDPVTSSPGASSRSRLTMKDVAMRIVEENRHNNASKIRTKFTDLAHDAALMRDMGMPTAPVGVVVVVW